MGPESVALIGIPNFGCNYITIDLASCVTGVSGDQCAMQTSAKTKQTSRTAEFSSGRPYNSVVYNLQQHQQQEQQ